MYFTLIHSIQKICSSCQIMEEICLYFYCKFCSFHIFSASSIQTALPLSAECHITIFLSVPPIPPHQYTSESLLPFPKYTITTVRTNCRHPYNNTIIIHNYILTNILKPAVLNSAQLPFIYPALSAAAACCDLPHYAEYPLLFPGSASGCSAGTPLM